ncbi:EAL domain-containing protein [Roseomonas sp. 18066]|uniref:sensor domain-containing protein n=1 Tax=Roseomonas sp. 18066 TaxID=2681412 RepID=UPI00135A5FC8|nr:EAL domain-containing protein [Roseomonas sp. 18066]
MSPGDLHHFLARCPLPAFLAGLDDGGFRFLQINPALAAVTGRPLEELVGRRPEELFQPDLARQLVEQLRFAWDGGCVVDLTACLPHADGPRDWDMALVPLPDPAGGTRLLVGYGIDPGEMARRRMAHQTGGQLVIDAFLAQEALIYRCRPDTALTFVNAAYARAAGRGPQHLLGQRLSDMVPAAERPTLLAQFARLTPEEPLLGHILRHKGADGRPGWRHWVNIAAFDAHGRMVEIHGIGRDITELQDAMLRVSESEHRFRTVVENIAEGIVLADEHGHIVYANRKVVEILGWTAEDLQGRHVAQLGNPQEASEHATYLERYLRISPIPVGSSAQESFARHRDGRMLRIHFSLSEVELDGVRHFIGVLRDNTAIHEAQQRIERLAYNDELTGLPNQRRLKEELARLLERPGARATLLLVDLVDFSALNGTIGFAAGDRVLRTAARRIADVLPHDCLLSRFGNDRFAVLMRDLADAERAQVLAGRIAVSVEGAVPEGHGESGFRLPPVTIGIAMAPVDDTRPDGLLEAAEIALLDAKRRAPGSIRGFASAMRNTAARRFSTAQGLRRALDHGGLFIEVQPRFTADQRQLTGGEALVRWRREDGCLIPPDDFVPLAEETGLIQPLTEFVFDQVMPLLARLRPGQRLSMNFPPAQLARHNLTAMIAARLARQGVPGDRLGIELTESALIGGPGLLDENLRELQRLGCAVAIDDFGTGYSSLSRLRHLPIDELKIDRVFIRDAARDAAGTAFLQAIGAMANALGLRLVAEGVETEEELDQARRIGCHEVQGWLWGRPMAPEEFLALCLDGGAQEVLA